MKAKKEEKRSIVDLDGGDDVAVAMFEERLSTRPV